MPVKIFFFGGPGLLFNPPPPPPPGISSTFFVRKTGLQQLLWGFFVYKEQYNATFVHPREKKSDLKRWYVSILTLEMTLGKSLHSMSAFLFIKNNWVPPPSSPTRDCCPPAPWVLGERHTCLRKKGVGRTLFLRRDRHSGTLRILWSLYASIDQLLAYSFWSEKKLRGVKN